MAQRSEHLALMDWRRQVADLYAEVRRLYRVDWAAALEHWRSTREQLYRKHPQSPLTRRVPSLRVPSLRVRSAADGCWGVRPGGWWPCR